MMMSLMFGDLWDQTKLVEQYTEHGVQSMEKINEYLKAVAHAEQEYAHTISKLSKAFKEDIVKKKSPLRADWFIVSC